MFLRTRTSIPTSLMLTSLLLLATAVNANVPYFFVDSNMALVLVPSDTPVGTTVYRVKAADSDGHYPLTFTVPDTVGRTLLDINSYNCTSNQDYCIADAILKRPLEPGVTSTFRLRVKDTTGEVTTVVAKVKGTRVTNGERSGIEDTFLELQKPLRVQETTKIGTKLRTISAKKGKQNIKFDLRGTSVLQLDNTRLISGGAACDIILKKNLDFEMENLIEFTVFAENGYRNSKFDTRNVVALPMILRVEDEQDTPPFFIKPPTVLKISGDSKPGDSIATFRAVDGDKYNPREVRYRLLPNGNGYDSFFSMDPITGNLSLTSSMTDLLTSPLDPMTVTVTAEEVTRALSERALSVNTDVVVILENDINQAPEFGSRLYVTRLTENPALGVLLNFAPPLKTTVSFGKGQRGTFALTIVGDLASKSFEVVPSVLNGDTEFNVRVKNNQLIDYEKLKRPVIKFRIRAEEVDRGNRIGRLLTSYTNVSVTVQDQNDQTPRFEKDTYEAVFNEDVERGTTILKVSAIDDDMNSNGRVTYTSLSGDNADDLSLDPSSGEISIKVSNHRFDFERQQEYRLQVRAVDGGIPERTGTASIVLTVQDVNDNGPEFTRKLYNGKLNADGNSLAEPVKVHAEDRDSGKNSKIEYRISGGGKFHENFDIDRGTGLLRVRKPVPMDLSVGSDRELRSSALQFERSDDVERGDDVINLEVSASDQGSPQRSNSVKVFIYKKEDVETFMNFLVKQDVDYVRRNRETVEEQLSKFTGGDAQITDIRKFEQDGELEERNGAKAEEKTLITALVLRRYDAIFDTTGLEGNSDGNTDGNTGDGDNKEVVTSATIDNVWFWLLIVLALIIIIIIIIVCCCCYCSFCQSCCPVCSCYKSKLVKEYDEEAVAYVGFDGEDAQRTNASHNDTVLGRVRRAVSGNAVRAGSVTNTRLAWSGNRRYRHLAGGARNSRSSTLRLIDAPVDEPGRDNIVLARHEMDEAVSRHARGGRDNQILLVPNEIGSLHRTHSRASKDGPRMYRVVGRDGRPHLAVAEGEGAYQLEDLELDDASLERLEMERRSVVGRQTSLDRLEMERRSIIERQNARRTPSIEVLTLEDQGGANDAMYMRQGSTDVLRLHTSARQPRREFYVDERGEEIERPSGRGRISDDQDIHYGREDHRGSMSRSRGNPRRRTRSEILVIEEGDEDEGRERARRSARWEEGREADEDEGGKEMLMKRFMNSQRGQSGRYENEIPEEQLTEEELEVTRQQRNGDVTVTSLSRRGDVIVGEAHVGSHAIKSPIQEETQSVLDREERETEVHVPLKKTPEPLYAQTKASILRRRNSKAALQEELKQAGLVHTHARSVDGDSRRRSDESNDSKNSDGTEPKNGRRRRARGSNDVRADDVRADQRGRAGGEMYESKLKYADSVKIDMQERDLIQRSPEDEEALLASNDHRQSNDNFQSNDRNQSNDRYQSNDSSQSNDRYQSNDRNQSNDRYQSNDRNQSNDRYQSNDRNQSNDRYQANDRNQANDRYQSNDRNQANDRYQSNDRYQADDRNQSSDRNQSNDRNQANDRYQSNDRNQSKDRNRSKDVNQSNDRYRRDSNERTNDGRQDRHDSRDRSYDREHNRHPSQDSLSIPRHQYRRQRSRSEDPGEPRENRRRRDHERRASEEEQEVRRRSHEEDERQGRGRDQRVRELAGVHLRSANGSITSLRHLGEDGSRPGSQLSMQFSNNMLNETRQQRPGSAGSAGRYGRGGGRRRDHGEDGKRDDYERKRRNEDFEVRRGEFQESRRGDDSGRRRENFDGKRRNYNGRAGEDFEGGRPTDEAKRNSDDLEGRGRYDGVDKRREDRNGRVRGRNDERNSDGGEGENYDTRRKSDDIERRESDRGRRDVERMLRIRTEDGEGADGAREKRWEDDKERRDDGDRDRRDRRSRDDQGHDDGRESRNDHGNKDHRNRTDRDRREDLENERNGREVRRNTDEERRRSNDRDSNKNETSKTSADDERRRNSDANNKTRRTSKQNDVRDNNSGSKSSKENGRSDEERKDGSRINDDERQTERDGRGGETYRKNPEESGEARTKTKEGNEDEPNTKSDSKQDTRKSERRVPKGEAFEVDVKRVKNLGGGRSSDNSEGKGSADDAAEGTELKSEQSRTGKLGSEKDAAKEADRTKKDAKTKDSNTENTKTGDKSRKTDSKNDKKDSKDKKSNSKSKPKKNDKDKNETKASKDDKESRKEDGKNNKSKKSEKENTKSQEKKDTKKDSPNSVTTSQENPAAPSSPTAHVQQSVVSKENQDQNNQPTDVTHGDRKENIPHVSAVGRNSDISIGDSGIGDVTVNQQQNNFDTTNHLTVTDPLNVSHTSSTFPDDSESTMSTAMVPGVKKKKNQFLEKKSIFTIAYDDIHTHRLRSDTPTGADV